MTIKELEIKACEIRKSIISIIYNAKGGHLGGALSSTDILTALYYNTMKIFPKNSKSNDRDRFILSKGHSVEGYYSILADLDFFDKSILNTYLKFNSPLIGHPNNKVHGVEMNTGALGHGLSIGVGMSIGLKKDNLKNKVFVLMGDGELAEGSVWEASMSASHYKLDNLTLIIDRNNLQISGNTENVMSLESIADKFKAFNWSVSEIDGNNMEEIINIFDMCPFSKDKPSLIIAHTTKGKGVEEIENIAKWHHGVPDESIYQNALSRLDNNIKELQKYV